jgi:hypothetical protein
MTFGRSQDSGTSHPSKHIAPVQKPKFSAPQAVLFLEPNSTIHRRISRDGWNQQVSAILNE